MHLLNITIHRHAVYCELDCMNQLSSVLGMAEEVHVGNGLSSPELSADGAIAKSTVAIVHFEHSADC